ncbi:sodium-coupled monocarboxylate transporter 1-like isoform X2 [Hylaeus anthracinus]|uniref:sodium-coupled monocarboxylate transporter 1-like isoform X2 n=1 Tax=Hylaeus anthracinus TaxID=313031 RepID=UPI0023B95B11|nr:sodium-coupled monocarboxylate transporter 1-like isoform X2 [Hylaeus anthracinus]
MKISRLEDEDKLDSIAARNRDTDGRGERGRATPRVREIARANEGSGVGTITTESPIIQSPLRVGSLNRRGCRRFRGSETHRFRPRRLSTKREDRRRYATRRRIFEYRFSFADIRINEARPNHPNGKRGLEAIMDPTTDRDADGSAQRSFEPIDCAVFAGMLGISAIVGVYQAYKSRKTTDAVREYLMGGQKMDIFPISMSLIASYISGIAILGLPAEMYVYGTQFWCVIISDSFVSLTMAVVYLPVFYDLGITSSYEYLNLRFNNVVRLTGTVIFLIKMLLYIPLVIYVPALAFNQVTGMNLHATALMVCAVCIFYTTLGGLKAVVWTDAIQTVVMFGGVVVVAVLGTLRVGGIERVWERNRDTGRIEFFEMNPDPTVRHTFWTVVVGGYLNWLASCSVNQAMVQRCLSMPNLKKANATIAIMAIGIISIVSLSCYTGLVIFAAFHDCDPVTTKQLRKADQLLPYFVMEMAGSIPGLPGLFVAGVFSAALSTMSTGLNSMSGVIYGDMIKPWLRGPVSEATASRTIKAIVVAIGAVCVALVFLVEKLTGLIQGALVGGLVSLNLVAWISFGTQAAISTGKINFPVKPVSVDGCPDALKTRIGNLTLVIETVTREEPFFLYRVSYLWYTWIGFLTAILLGLLVSWITGANVRKPGDEKLYTPLIRGFLSSDLVATSRQETVELAKIGTVLSSP